MLHLVYSNRFEELCGALVESIAAAREDGRGDLFTGATILVPNAQVATAIKLAMARREGIAAGLAFPFIEGFTAGCVARARPDRRVLDQGRLQLLVHGALSDAEFLGESEMAPIRAYLDAAGDDAGARSLRRVQLSSQISGLYVDYSLYRPELMAAWSEGRAYLDSTEHAATEAWQRRLWRALTGEESALAAVRRETGTTWQLLPQLIADIPPDELGLPPELYAIGFSHLSPGYQALFARIAEASELCVYALNPCMEYWEDLPAGWELRRRPARRRGAAAAEDPGAELDPPALKLWGRPGRETVRMLDELTDCDFDPRFVDPGRAGHATALTSLQRDILTRAPERHGPDPELADDDASIRVLACPSPRRELEIIGGEIRALMAADASLRFNDVAILVSRSAEETYQAQIGSVFHELGDIPYHLVDRPLPLESRYAEALELLLDLPLGRFTRPELLRVLSHPAVLARDPDLDPDAWLRWIDALGVAHGADRSDFEGTYIDGDVFNWDQAIRRLALGAVMTGARSGDDRAVEIGEGRYVPEELGADELASAARLGTLARSLIADACYARDQVMLLARWQAFFDALATSYLHPVTDADERHLERCRAALAGLTDMDLEGRPLDFRGARELARGALASLRVSRGELFAHGVLVAPLSPMRPLPFRIVFVAGLGQGQFPSAERERPIDLRAADRKPGDVSASERDRYTFLEALLSARDRIYVSYVARDEESGEALSPSSVVSELIEIVERGYRGPSAPPLVTRFPLRAFDARCVPDVYAAAGEDEPADPIAAPASAAARSQAGALALRRHLDRHLQASRGRSDQPLPSPEDIRLALADPGREALRARLRLPDLPAGRRDDATEAELALSLGVLRRFLESPIQAWAQAVLRLRDDDFDDRITVEDEPFASDPITRASLLRGAFTSFLGAGDRAVSALARAYEQEHDVLSRAGRAPVGLFSDVERARHQTMLESWCDGLAKALAREAPRAAPVHLGSARENIEVRRIVPPVVLEGIACGAEGAARRDVSIYGATHLVSDEGDIIVVLDTSAGGRSSMVLRGLLDHAVLAAAGIGHDVPRRLAHVHADKTRCYQLAPLSSGEARELLAELAGDLLGDSHAYLLPGDVVLEFLRKPDGKPLVDRILALRDSGKLEHGHEVVRRLHRFAPPADAEALARRRLAPLWDKVEAVT